MFHALAQRAYPVVVILASGIAAFPQSSIAQDSQVQRDLAALRSVGPNGRGASQAREAAERLSTRGPELLVPLLELMDTENIVAANWARSVFDTIVERELQQEQPRLPLEEFQRVVQDPQRQGRLRRRVLAILDRVDPEFGRQTIPKLLDDPEFRRDAVAAAIDVGDKARKRGDLEAARRAYRTAFEHGRDVDQLTSAARRLETLGEKVSIIQQMGFVTDWYLLGPFDAPGTSGFRTTFPPEAQPHPTDALLKQSYTGKDGRTLRWKAHHTDDPLGLVNLNRALGATKEAVGYAWAVVEAPADMRVQLRCGADDNLTVWINGRKVLAREQWLNGTRLDRFTAPVDLKAGRNVVFVKICQGPQHRNPAVPNNWSLQLRFTTEDGRGAGLRTVAPPPDTAQNDHHNNR